MVGIIRHNYEMIIAARCPTGASDDIKNMWSNGLAAVDDVRAEDEQQEDVAGLRFKVTEPVSRSDGDLELPGDILVLCLQPAYQTLRDSKYPKAAPSTPRRQRNVRSDRGDDADSEGDVDMFELSAAKNIDLERKDGQLISPDELYVKLTEGTLFMATITLETFIIKERQKPARWLDKKIYHWHIYVSKLKILDRRHSVLAGYHHLMLTLYQIYHWHIYVSKLKILDRRHSVLAGYHHFSAFNAGFRNEASARQQRRGCFHLAFSFSGQEDKICNCQLAEMYLERTGRGLCRSSALPALCRRIG
ncbi:hypothetical protein GGX14DRAFT_541993 [Mycena pura]|uniref:Uncharacterized protein n=1 Tax=Mycena pura TaxID=153505 RepID=A0AAD6YEY9_9AGAR|nr:hypothetical protein GGX14DRAFT_541993 [Mycena pura]